MNRLSNVRVAPQFGPAELAVIAHLYRGEVYRSTTWRTRLDATTNWAVVTTGIALSATFSSAEGSPLPMVLVGLLVTVFLLFEARRYRYFDVWRTRARMLERGFYVPLLRSGLAAADGWQERLAEDYERPSYHLSFVQAVGRRLRRNYGWILGIQAVAYYGKLIIHPQPIESIAQVWDRASIGPIPGGLVVLAGLLFHGGWACFALWTLHLDRRERAAKTVIEQEPEPEIDAEA
jgi:uncharacterized membrane protein